MSSSGVYWDTVREALQELSDRSEQERLWLATSVEVSSPVECFERLWTDSGLGDALERGEVWDAPIDDALRSLLALTGRFDTRRPVNVVLADPALAYLRARAREVLAQIQ